MNLEEAAQKQAEYYTKAAEYLETQAMFSARSAMLVMERAEIDKRIGELLLQRMQNESRPSVIMKAILTSEDGMYVATYGDLSAIGETPEAAFQAFDNEWVGHV